MIKKIIIKFINIYKIFISPILGKNCRFYPSCSSYAVISIEKYGIFMGTIKSIIRILKCHPFNKGGVDLP